MRLRDAAFLADESIHPKVVQLLRAKKVNVLDVRENSMTGSDDLVLITRDVVRIRLRILPEQIGR